MWLRRTLPLLWIAVLSALVLRTHLRLDERWGFSMFGDIRRVGVTWTWILEDGGERAARMAPHLSGETRRLAANPDEGTQWALGVGTLRSEVAALATWMARVHPHRNGVALQAVIRHRQWGRGEWEVETITVAVPSGSVP